MRTEQRAVLAKHRKAPGRMQNGIESEKCGLELEKGQPLSSNTPEERRSVHGWARPIVSKSAVSNKRTAISKEVDSTLNEKGAEATIACPTQSEKEIAQLLDWRRSGEKCNDSTTNSDSKHGEVEVEPPTQQSDKPLSSKPTAPVQQPLPVICIDKPLPPPPTLALSSDTARSASHQLSDGNAGHSPGKFDHEGFELLRPSPSVRRIKSYGDVLSLSPSKLRPSAVERRASHLDLRSRGDSEFDGSHSLIPSGTVEPAETVIPEVTRFLSPISAESTPPSAASSAGRLLKKRSSSLGLGRRASNTSTETVKPSVNAPESCSAVSSARTVSSATAPPATAPFDSDPHRKRKTSMFSGLFSGLWKPKAREPVQGPVIDGHTTESLLAAKQSVLTEQDDSQEDAPRSPSPISPGAVLLKQEAATQPSKVSKNDHNESAKSTLHPGCDTDAPAYRRRYSIVSSFFRTVPTPSNKSTGVPEQSTLPTSQNSVQSPVSVIAEPRQPIDIPPSSLPRLPTFSQDLGDISFGSLFDTADKRGGGRSRASTRGSLHSLFSSSPKSSSPQRESAFRDSPRSSGSRSRSNSQLKQSLTASDIATHPWLSPEGVVQPDKYSVAHYGERPKSPIVNGIIAEERRRTRPFRSNSASSVSTTRSLIDEALPSAVIKPSRPMYGRARSSSTISTNAASRTLSPLPEGAVIVGPTTSEDRRPSIMVTSERSSDYSTLDSPSKHRALPAASSIDTNSEATSRASRSSSISTGWPSPALSNDAFGALSSSDANLVDAIEDFVLTPPDALDTRTSAETDVTGRGSFSSASSLLSTSPGFQSIGPHSIQTSNLIGKTLRRRANTLGSMLATSASSSGTPGRETQGDAPPDATEGFGIAERNSSSSRISSFFGSPATTLSSSPVESTGLWLAPHGAGKAVNTSGRDILHPAKRIMRRLSSSLLTSSTPLSERSISSPSSPRLSASMAGSTGVSSGHDGLVDVVNGPASMSMAAAGNDRSESAILPDLRIEILPDETPATFLALTKKLAGPQDTARILSEKSDSFHNAALRLFMEDFDFVNDPIDIAIRKLLLGLHLPKETQQIDRVMQAFADRYNTCNPALFISPDHPYILAFSIIMLHTDAFNKSNKKKMTRAAYVKNTKVEGVSPILLEYIYDNITYAPFTYADAVSDSSLSTGALESGTVTGNLASSTSKERNKVELYRLIAGNQTARHRVDMGLLVPIKNPFSYTGTVAFFDCSILRKAFTYAHTVRLPDARLQEHSPGIDHTSAKDLVLRVARVGTLERKEDTFSSGKKAGGRKWRSWGVLLLETQLVFFRDAKRILGLQTSIREAGGADIPQSTQQSVDILWRSDFRPDEIISLDGLIVLYDFTYTRHTNTFRCIQPDGRQILFRASDEADLNLWMSTINYAATFRTAGIRLRMSPYDDRSDGDLNLPQPKNQSLAQIKFSTATSIYAASISPSELGFMPAASRTDSGDSAADNVDGQMQDLMFPRAITSDLETWKELPRSMMHHATRGDIERSKIMELEAAIRLEQTALAEEIRLVRNIAILSPLNGGSRHRLQQAAETVAQGIRRTRQEIAKLICYRECLCRDLLATERDVHRHRFHQSISSSQANLRTADLAVQLDAGVINGSAKSTVPGVSGLFEGARMSKSASQDELASLARTPNLLRRSLTADAQRPGDVLAHTLQSAGTSGDEPSCRYRRKVSADSTGNLVMPTSFSAKIGESPTLGSGTFETVAEGWESSNYS